MIEGSSVNLRLLEDRDIDEYLVLENRFAEKGDQGSPRLMVPGPFRQAFAEHGWWKDDLGMLLVTDKAGRLLGSISFFEGMAHEAGYEIGYGILRGEDRGRGYATEAVLLFSAYLFEVKPIARLHAKIVAGNVASQRVLEKCGYRLEGTLRRFGYFRGEVRDHEIYALLREECPSIDSLIASPPGPVGDQGTERE